MGILDLAKAKAAAEETLGFEIDSDTAASILSYAAKKCIASNNGLDYLEILYENELCDHFMRMAVTVCSANGGLANV